MGIIEDFKTEFEAEALLIPAGPPFPVEKKARERFEREEQRYVIKKVMMDQLFKKYSKRDFEEVYDLEYLHGPLNDETEEK